MTIHENEWGLAAREAFIRRKLGLRTVEGQALHQLERVLETRDKLGDELCYAACLEARRGQGKDFNAAVDHLVAHRLIEGSGGDLAVYVEDHLEVRGVREAIERLGGAPSFGYVVWLRRDEARTDLPSTPEKDLPTAPEPQPRPTPDGVLEAEGRWARLRDKVEDNLEQLAKRAEAGREGMAAATRDLLGTPLTSAENQLRSAEVYAEVDNARRTYSAYDALRSVLLWMDGYGPATSHLEREVARLTALLNERDGVPHSGAPDQPQPCQAGSGCGHPPPYVLYAPGEEGLHACSLHLAELVDHAGHGGKYVVSVHRAGVQAD